MADYTPAVTKADIDRILQRDYPHDSPEAVWKVLLGYGSGEAHRIYAAALKEGQGNLEKLTKAIELANLDYRDLLVAAEYPGRMKEGLFGSPKPETIADDRRQYDEWFHK